MLLPALEVACAQQAAVIAWPLRWPAFRPAGHPPLLQHMINQLSVVLDCSAPSTAPGKPTVIISLEAILFIVVLICADVHLLCCRLSLRSLHMKAMSCNGVHASDG